MAGAVHQLFQAHAGTDVQRADALGRVDLVSGDGQQVHSQIVHVDRYLTHRLGTVGVKQHSPFPGDLAYLFQRLDGADLVVGVHDGNQNRLGSDGIGHLLGVHHAKLVHG